MENKEEKKDTSRTVRRSYTQKNILNALVIIAGLVAVVLFMLMLQREYSIRKQNLAANRALDGIVQTLDENTESVQALLNRYHEDNQSVLNDVLMLLKSGTFRNSVRLKEEERSAMISKLSEAVGGSGYLIVIDEEGNIVMAPESDRIGTNMISDGTFSEEDMRILTRGEKVGEVRKNGTSVTTRQPDGTIRVSYDAVTATPAGTDITAYFYSQSIGRGNYLLYGVDTAVLEAQYAILRDIEPLLSNVAVGETGFVFAVDESTQTFKYFNDGRDNLTGAAYKDYGLTSAALKNNYSGIQKINGSEYLCLSRKYSSPVYGEYTVITAVCTTAEVFSSDRLTVTITAVVFLLTALICMLYAYYTRMEAEHLVAYDEKIIDRKKLHKERMSEEKFFSLKNIRLGRVRGHEIYFKIGIAEQLLPLMCISLLLVFLVSWNAQTLTQITRGMNDGDTAMQQVKFQYRRNVNNYDRIVESYEGQYLAKARLISYLLEEDPSILKEGTLHTAGEDAAHVYKNEDYTNLKDSNGRDIISVANSSTLKEFAANNRVDVMYMFDDHGRVIFASDDYWYFTLSSNPEDQSYELNDIIMGKRDSIVQESMIDDNGKTMQYIATAWFYYTLEGPGNAAGTRVSKKVYNSYVESGVYMHEDNVRYSIVPHRGMLEIGITDETLALLTRSMSADYLMQQSKVGVDGFIILFDNEPEHYCIWSPNASEINRTAEDMDIGEDCFSGTFKGFIKKNGKQYFQNIQFTGNYWLAATIPTDTMYAGRTQVALVTTIVSGFFFLILYIFSVFSSDSEEEAVEAIISRNMEKRGDNGIVKMTMPNGKVKYVRAVSARFDNRTIPWGDQNANQRLGTILKYAGWIMGILIMIVLAFSDKIFGENSAVTYIVRGDWERSPNYFAFVSFVVLVLFVSIVAGVVTRFINFVIRNMGTRVETIGRLLLSVIKYGSVLFSIFYSLSLMGISTAGLVTSASIMSIVIGLGAQSLISDILAGIFIVFEGAFRVGDIVEVGGFRGNVVDIGLRTTKLENFTGDIKILNNTQVSGVVNTTRKSSYALCDVGIEYGESIERVEAVLEKEFPKMRKAFPSIISGPFYKGVTELAESSVVIRIIAECEERDRAQLARDLNRHIYILFEKNDINIPFPQITLSNREGVEHPVSPYEKRLSNKLIQKQHAETDIETNNN